MPEEFYHEEIQQVPAGYRVRTLTTQTGHEVRLAFPPGPRKRGSGRLVSILHPHLKNTCAEIKRSALSNPHEMVKDSKGKQWLIGVISSGKDFLAEAYPVTGKKIKRAGRVIEARGVSEADAYDRLLGKMEPNPKGQKTEGNRQKADFIHPNPSKEKNLFGLFQQKKDKKPVIKPGDFVKYRLSRHGVGERIWAKVTSVSGSNIQAVLDNEPVVATDKHMGDSVRFKKKQIIEVWGNPKSANPKSKNFDEITEAKRTYKKFQGKESKNVLDINEPGQARDDFAELGWLTELVIQSRAHSPEVADPDEVAGMWEEAPQSDKQTSRVWTDIARELDVTFIVISFRNDKVRLASSPNGKQLYCIGGSQNLDSALGRFGVDETKDFVELGFGTAVTYLARKANTDFEPVEHVHTLGEDGGMPPIMSYNKLQKRIGFVGGTYKVAPEGIIH